MNLQLNCEDLRTPYVCLANRNRNRNKLSPARGWPLSRVSVNPVSEVVRSSDATVAALLKRTRIGRPVPRRARRSGLCLTFCKTEVKRWITGLRRPVRLLYYVNLSSREKMLTLVGGTADNKRPLCRVQRRSEICWRLRSRVLEGSSERWPVEEGRTTPLCSHPRRLCPSTSLRTIVWWWRVDTGEPKLSLKRRDYCYKYASIFFHVF